MRFSLLPILVAVSSCRPDTYYTQPDKVRLRRSPADLPACAALP